MVKSGSGEEKGLLERGVGYRTKLRLERKARLKRRLKITLLVLAGLIVVGAVITAVSASESSLSFLRNLRERFYKSSPKQEKFVLGNKATFLVIGVVKEGDREKAQGLLVMFFSFKSKEINAINISGDTFVEIPGHGFDKISSSLASGIPTTLSATKDLLGLDIEHYLKIGYSDFEVIVINKSGIPEMFVKTTATDLSQKEREEVSKVASGLKSTDIHIFTLPVKSITVGEATYLQPEKEKIGKLVAKLWNIKSFKVKQQVRIVVLNGSGVPGVAGEVAQKLIQVGYKVIDAKNADNFDYEETQIVAYNKTGKKATSDIKRILGVGVPLDKNVKQDLADLAVVVGKDYKPN